MHKSPSEKKPESHCPAASVLSVGYISAQVPAPEAAGDRDIYCECSIPHLSNGSCFFYEASASHVVFQVPSKPNISGREIGNDAPLFSPHSLFIQRELKLCF